MITSPAPASLAGSVALVTGGTRGIGAACAVALADLGATVVITGTGEERVVADRAATLRDSPGAEVGSISGLHCDNADESSIAGVYRRVRGDHGRLDVLVNNAGIMEGGMLGMLTAEAIARTLAVNTTGALLHLQAAARVMRKSGGSIINLTSILGIRGNAGQSVYAASKAAVVGVTLSAAKELAPQGIRVNAVAPGFIDTDLTTSLSESDRTTNLSRIALGRFGRAEEVADLVAFLASTRSSYLTGQIIGVDGGMVI